MTIMLPMSLGMRKSKKPESSFHFDMNKKRLVYREPFFNQLKGTDHKKLVMRVTSRFFSLINRNSKTRGITGAENGIVACRSRKSRGAKIQDKTEFNGANTAFVNS